MRTADFTPKAPTRTREPHPVARRAGCQEGAAMVEFAIVLPILLLMLFGMTEFGRALNYWIDGSHLATSTARWAVVNKNPGPEATLQDSMLSQADTAELRAGGTDSVPDPMEICIEWPDDDSPEIGDAVKATASVDFNWLPLIGDTIGVGTTTLEGSATMRLEQEPTAYTDTCSGA